MENSAPPKRLDRFIWERKNFPSCPSSIFSIRISAAMSAAVPSSTPEETTIPWYIFTISDMDSERPGVLAKRWRKVRKLES